MAAVAASFRPLRLGRPRMTSEPTEGEIVRKAVYVAVLEGLRRQSRSIARRISAVTALHGEPLATSFGAAESMRDVRRQAAAALGLPTRRLRLIHGGEEVTDACDMSCLLPDCCISVLAVAGGCRVACRIRPLTTQERERRAATAALEPDEPRRLVALPRRAEEPRRAPLHFDSVFCGSDQERVFDFCRGALHTVLEEGVDACVLAYGQTGSGKLHTICGPRASSSQRAAPSELAGVLPRAVAEALRRGASVRFSMARLHQEHLTDLMAEDRPGRRVVLLRTGGFVAEGLLERPCTSVREAQELMDLGLTRLNVDAVHAGITAGSCHLFCSLLLTCGGARARLHLVRLAGSERLRPQEDGAARGLAGEGAARPLTVLHRCLSALAKQAQALASPQRSVLLVPYRDSKLTMLLKSALPRCWFVATVSPTALHQDETTSTLTFAHRLM